MNEFESNKTRPQSAPIHRNNSNVIENTDRKRGTPIRLENTSSDMIHTLNNHIAEEDISVEGNQQKFSETLVEKTTDRLVQEMSRKLAEWNSDKLVHVVSDKLVGSISSEIMHSVSDKVVAEVLDKLRRPIKSKVYTDRMSRKLFSECRNKTLELKGGKPRYFIIKSCNKEKVLSSMRENEGPVYLFFSVNKSKCFCGVAKMLSPVDYKTRWSQWKQNNGRWQECFDVSRLTEINILP